MNNPAARVFKQDWASFGKAKDFPYAATTYRVTEHFHFWTKHSHLNATTQPEQFVEISEELAKEKGIGSGDKVVVSSNRGRDHGEGGGHQAHQAARGGRQGGAPRRHPHPLGVHRRGEEGAPRQHPHPRSSATRTRRRPSTSRSSSTSRRPEEVNHGTAIA